MNTKRIILALLISISAAGCGKSKLPSWLGGPGEVPITQSKASPEQAGPVKPKKSKPSSPQKNERRKVSAQPSTEPSPLLPRPLTKTALYASTKTLTQTDPSLLALSVANENHTLTSLSTMKSVEPAKAPILGFQPKQSAPTEPMALSALTKDNVQLPKPKAKPAKLEKAEIEKPLQLAPLAEPEEGLQASLKRSPNGAEPDFGPAANPQDDLALDEAQDSTEELPWNLDKRRLADEEKKFVRIQAQRKREELELAPPVKDKPIVMNHVEIVAGQTLQVNNEYITVDDVLAAFHQDLARIPKKISEKDFRSQAGRTLGRGIFYQIQQVIVNAEAEKYLEDAAKAQVDKEMKDTLRDMIAIAGGSKEKLKQKWLREGTTLNKILKTQRMNLTVTIYLQSKFYPAIVVNRRMLWNYYRKNHSEFKSEKKVQMQIIAQPFRAFLPKNKKATPEEQALARKKAQQEITKAWNKLQAGEKFTDVAKELSRGLRAKEGGSWAMMAMGNFRNTEVEAVAFKLSESAYSKVIEAPTGFYIVKAQDVEYGKEIPFEQAQETIELELRQDQFMDIRANYMKKLYDRATIGNTKSFILLAVDQAVQKYYR